MALTITGTPTGELLSVDEAKRHLRLLSDDLDDELASLIRDSRDWCERITQRTLRAAVTRTLKFERWWSNYCSDGSYANGLLYGFSEHRHHRQSNGLHLPWPPLIAVSSVTYYDINNALQTLASSNYSVSFSTDGGGRIDWVVNATIPAAYCRKDAITVLFTTGYADATTIPPVALRAMKTTITELWGAGTGNEIKAARDCTARLLSSIDWTGYA